MSFTNTNFQKSIQHIDLSNIYDNFAEYFSEVHNRTTFDELYGYGKSAGRTVQDIPIDWIIDLINQKIMNAMDTQYVLSKLLRDGYDFYSLLKQNKLYCEITYLKNLIAITEKISVNYAQLLRIADAEMTYCPQLKYYTLHGNQLINSALRRTNLAMSKIGDKLYTIIIEAFAKVPKLITPITVYRGVKNHYEINYGELKSGDTFTSIGLTSCSLQRRVAQNFVSQSDYILEIQLPRDISILYLGLSVLSYVAGEDEIVLANGAAFQVTNISPGQPTYIKCNFIGYVEQPIYLINEHLDTSFYNFYKEFYYDNYEKYVYGFIKTYNDYYSISAAVDFNLPSSLCLTELFGETQNTIRYEHFLELFNQFLDGQNFVKFYTNMVAFQKYPTVIDVYDDHELITISIIRREFRKYFEAQKIVAFYHEDIRYPIIYKTYTPRDILRLY